MPTTFNVLSLGVQPIIDPTEGNNVAENASALENMTFGSVTDPLWELSQSFSPGTGGFGGGTSTAYDQDNSLSNESFRLDGGPEQVFDASVVYNAVITYTDGTTANITAVVFQDTAGNTYLAPEFSANADQTALEAGPIRSLTLNSLVSNTFSGMTGSRQTSNFAVCFTAGTMIATPDGERAIETLKVGDLVETLDNGPQAIRWIGGRTVPATDAMNPVTFAAGSLGKNLPKRRMTLSRQHRVMLDNIVAERMTGHRQVLIPAHKLRDLPRIKSVEDQPFIDYWHFICDDHQIVFAEGTPAETLYLGQQARKSLSPEALTEIAALFPDLFTTGTHGQPVRDLMKGATIAKLLSRLRRNSKDAIAVA